MIVVCTAQNAVFKNHPKDISLNENYIYRIILCLTSNTGENTIRWLDIEVSKKNAHCLPSLTDHSCKARGQTNSTRWDLLYSSDKLPVVYSLCVLSFLLSSIRLCFFMQQNRIKVLIFHIYTSIDTFLE